MNLVIGAAVGYGWDILEPFVLSCRKNCPTARLVLFVDDISDFTRDRLIRAGVRLENLPDEMRHGISNNTRWKILGDYLDAHGNEYEQVFCTDTRDVIFQGDLFAPFKGYTDWLGYATEADDIAGSKTSNGVNYKWLADCFGKAEADKLADKKIICSGTIIGSVNEMKIFCRELWKVLEHKTNDIFDQAVTNYLVYNNLLPIENLIEIDCYCGEILTAFFFYQQYPIKTLGDKILRGDGGVPAVVHQYDRQSELIRLVDENYHTKNFSFDLRFGDTRSIVEQIICLLCADKTVEATKYFLRKFLSPSDFGKSKDALIKIWELAIQKNFSPTIELLELAVQNVLTTAQNFSATQIFRIYKILTHSIKNHHAVDLQFKENFAARLYKIGEQHLAADSADDCLVFINMIENLDMPPDKNFYLLAAKANRMAGRKDEALAYYTKALGLAAK